jgi:hypothetical protein
MSSGMIFVIVIVAIVVVGRIVRSGMELEARKHGFSLSGKKVRDVEARALRSKVARLEERMAVMERIATDAPDRLSAEIEKLRD